jgi:hypothetical protein
MKLRIGDKVKFLNEKGGGVIVRLKDSETAVVEDSEGFEIPYLIKYLVPIHNELVINKDAINIDIEPNKSVEDRVYFIAEMDNEIISKINSIQFYIYNSSSYNLHFTYSIKDGNLFQTLKHGEIGQYQKLAIKKINRRNLPEYNLHKIDLLFYKNTHYPAQLPSAEIIYLGEHLINSNNLIKHHEFQLPILAFPIKENFMLANQIKYNLTEYDLERLNKIKEFNPDKKISKPHSSNISKEKEVDLHIENLLESFKGMTNSQIIQFQLRYFQKELENAISNEYQKVIFIHGVGNGRLKQEILAILRNYPELKIQDASFKKYGFGATEVLITKQKLINVENNS